MVNNVNLSVPALKYTPVHLPNPKKAPDSGTVAQYGAKLELGNSAAPKSGQYAKNGLPAEDSKRIQTEKSRTKKDSEPCQTCQDRKYQDGSDDMGVSFQTPTSVAPAAAASAVRAHEQEHVSRNRTEGEQKDMNVRSSVIIHTSICPDCHKVYVSGGTTYTDMTPKANKASEAIDAYMKSMGA